ncbi:MAG: LytTR family transcriptional regulator DNA-binding domain-containing protein [Lachnospiraceae bacterium]|nr:LytTR family transcriptional regulator DNA-binding domain-containing protein [Lachnospiraceae bacterium]
MRVEVNPVDSYDQERAEIYVVKVTQDIQSAIDTLDNNCRVISVFDKEKTLICRTDKIYYFESIDKRTYVYTKDECFETKYRLYELEELLNQFFLRSSKAMIVNIRKIKSVKAEFNGRMTAELLNGENIVIARSYVKDLKERLGI